MIDCGKLHRSAGSGHDLCRTSARTSSSRSSCQDQVTLPPSRKLSQPRPSQELIRITPGCSVQRNKRSLAVDMAKPEGRIAIQRLCLAGRCSVSPPIWKPPSARNWNLAMKRLSGLNDFIYASFSGYGENGAEGEQAWLRCHGVVGAVSLLDTVRASSNPGAGATHERHGRSLCRFHAHSGIVMAKPSAPEYLQRAPRYRRRWWRTDFKHNGYNAQAAQAALSTTVRSARSHSMR